MAIAVFIVLSLIGGVLSAIFSSFLGSRPISDVPVEAAVPSAPLSLAVYFPPRPEDAPDDIRDAVMLGYDLMINTRQRLPDHVGNELSCASCHFAGGISRGGRNGGLSLVGVAATYPRFENRQDYSTDLVARTNNCFERSMNGKALDPRSNEMTALLTYYQWISKGVPIYAKIPWLGVKRLPPDDHTPNADNGKMVYANRCAACHGKDGEGTLLAPPVWGPRSFNDGAGMHVAATFAAFTLHNMPKGNPTLSPAEALDVAAFVTSQPRPHFELGDK